MKNGGERRSKLLRGFKLLKIGIPVLVVHSGRHHGNEFGDLEPGRVEDHKSVVGRGMAIAVIPVASQKLRELVELVTVALPSGIPGAIRRFSPHRVVVMLNQSCQLNSTQVLVGWNHSPERFSEEIVPKFTAKRVEHRGRSGLRDVENACAGNSLNGEENGPEPQGDSEVLREVDSAAQISPDGIAANLGVLKPDTEAFGKDGKSASDRLGRVILNGSARLHEILL
jgi:hypothetical protein